MPVRKNTLGNETPIACLEKFENILQVPDLLGNETPIACKENIACQEKFENNLQVSEQG